MSLTKKIIKEVIVTGKGDKKHTAFASALNKIQAQVMAETSEVLLRIEPQDVKVLSSIKETYKEKFLFFFFPRQRSDYHVKLEVTIEITLIALAEVEFKETVIRDPEGLKNPFRKKNKVSSYNN